MAKQRNGITGKAGGGTDRNIKILVSFEITKVSRPI